jgi:hypothetical protein
LLAPQRSDIAAYVQRMDLYACLSDTVKIRGSLPPEERRDQSHVLLELRHVVTPAEAEQVTTWFANIAQERFGAGAIASFHALGELLDNATTHGESGVGAFAAAQLYTGKTSHRPGLELAVCDAGIGVLEHLRRNPKHHRLRTSSAALRLALRPGVSGTADRRGYGLHDVLDRIGRLGMSGLILASGDAALHRRTAGPDALTHETALTSPIEGTWAWLRVRLPIVAD